jgi:signal transduction histidine kinase
MAEDGKLSVTIRDDGRGFLNTRKTGLGLIGMQERVESLGGNLAVNSEPGKGTAIDVSLPLPQRVAAGRPTAVSFAQNSV